MFHKIEIISVLPPHENFAMKWETHNFFFFFFLALRGQQFALFLSVLIKHFFFLLKNAKFAPKEQEFKQGLPVTNLHFSIISRSLQGLIKMSSSYAPGYVEVIIKEKNSVILIFLFN